MFSSYITLKIQTSKPTSIFRKSVSKYPGMRDTLLQILSSGALYNISFPCALDKMTLRENLTIESWENRKLHDLQEKNEIRVMEEQGRPWPTGEKWNPGHGGTGKTMTYRRKMKSRSWRNRENHDPQNEIENRTMFLPFCPVCRDAPSLFRLFANTLHKINHARRNLTFICKITPRVNFYYLL